MDKKVGVLALLLSAMFGGCSSDESVINEGGENNGKEVGYVAVNIVQAESASSRAVDVPDEPNDKGGISGGYWSGDDEENFAEEATFIIYDGEKYNSTQTIHLTPDVGAAENPQREKIYSAVLVIDSKDKVTQSPDIRYSGEIFCVLNAPSAIKDFNTNGDRTKATLKKLIVDCGTCTKGSFIMSNSTYRDTYTSAGHTYYYNSVISGATFTEANFCKTSGEALKNPVDIYVERVVARVDTKKGASFDNTTGADPFNVTGDANTTNDGDKMKIRITGIEIANIADKSYIFKNVDGYGNDDSGWPKSWGESNVWDAQNKRCYWEFVPPTEGEKALKYINQSYNQISGGTKEDVADTESTADDIYVSLSEDNYKTRTYIQPNTSATKTSVLVTAQLLDKDGKKLPDDLVWIKGGYFTSTDALKFVCQYLKTNEWAVKTVTVKDGVTSTVYSDIVPTDLVWARYINSANGNVKGNLLNPELKDYEALAQVDASKFTDANGRSICKARFDNDKKTVVEVLKEGDIAYSITDLNGAINGRNYCLAAQKDLFAEVFKDGLCYYYVNIDQTGVLGTIPSGTAHYDGVVRNHIYDLSLLGIKGIGTAVFDPTATIIPQKPSHDKYYYLAARINVLKWKIVKQGITFGD